MSEVPTPSRPPGLPLSAASAFAAVPQGAAIPVDQRTHEGRYVWDPRLHSFPTGLGGSPTALNGAAAAAAEMAFLHHQHRAAQAAVAADPGAPSPYRLSPYLDQMYNPFSHSPPLGMRVLSPLEARGVSMHMDYLQQMAAIGQQRLIDLHHNSTQAAAELSLAAAAAAGLDGTRITSPRNASLRGRKRAMSSSPYSDAFDINSMIRFSPNQLVSFMNGSRSSSANAGGSYGHLSAGGALSPTALGVISPTHVPTAAHLQHLQQLMRPYMMSPGGNSYPHSVLHHPGIPRTEEKRETASNIVSSTVSGHPIAKQNQRRSKKESAPTPTPMRMTSPNGFIKQEVMDPESDMKDEPEDFIETNCHWIDCGLEFLTQQELVNHINNDHIHASKKLFVCRWRNCSREEKPFKAQYMLVVHMRRHTGEKPNRCTFEGCTKAYSRLENLKTHLRSHTGEKPYMCEFPGCTKAFSNASDRAKHQNRTHSNEKPYVCRAPGCTKRYTDPSSLRKHVKTVHGAEFYASKKHKGIGIDPSEDNGGMAGSSEGSPRSDDGANKLASVSSPSTKSEDQGSPQMDTSSPYDGGDTMGADMSPIDHQQNIGMSETSFQGPTTPLSDNSVSTTCGQMESVTLEAQPGWQVIDPDELDVDDFAVVITSAVTSSGNGSSELGGPNLLHNRLRNRFNAPFKGIPSNSYLSTGIPSNQRLNGNIGNSHFGGSVPSRHPGGNHNNNQKHFTDLSNSTSQHSNRLSGGCMTQETSFINRRDSNTSTISSFYGSMASDATPLTSASSEATKSFATNTSYNSDPIGASCRMSNRDLSNYSTVHYRNMNGASLEQTSNLVIQPQNISMSAESLLVSSAPQNPNIAVKLESGGEESMQSNPSPPHAGTDNAEPNGGSSSQALSFEACQPDKPIEELEDLVLPDDMVNYLAQRQRPSSALSQSASSVSEHDNAQKRQQRSPSKAIMPPPTGTAPRHRTTPSRASETSFISSQVPPALPPPQQRTSRNYPNNSSNMLNNNQENIGWSSQQQSYSYRSQATSNLVVSQQCNYVAPPQQPYCQTQCPPIQSQQTNYHQQNYSNCNGYAQDGYEPPCNHQYTHRMQQQKSCHQPPYTNCSCQTHSSCHPCNSYSQHPAMCAPPDNAHHSGYHRQPNMSQMPQPNLIVQQQNHPPQPPAMMMPPTATPTTACSCSAGCCSTPKLPNSSTSRTYRVHCSTCSHCSNPQPEIQCRNVSQSSRENMAPDVYNRTLEYVQQCQSGPVPPQDDLESTASSLGGVSNSIQPSDSVSNVNNPLCSVLSPGCNTVTSTTDRAQQAMAADSSGAVKPTARSPTNSSSTGTASTTIKRESLSGRESSRSRHPQSPLLHTTNMVINNMTGSLTSLMQETTHLKLLQ